MKSGARCRVAGWGAVDVGIPVGKLVDRRVAAGGCGDRQFVGIPAGNRRVIQRAGGKIDRAGNGCYIFLLMESQAAKEQEQFVAARGQAQWVLEPSPVFQTEKNRKGE